MYFIPFPNHCKTGRSHSLASLEKSNTCTILQKYNKMTGLGEVVLMSLNIPLLESTQKRNPLKSLDGLVIVCMIAKNKTTRPWRTTALSRLLGHFICHITKIILPSY